MERRRLEHLSNMSEKENAWRFMVENMKERDNLRDLDVDDTNKLKCTFNK
jgi:hypothetical protein